MRHVAEPKEPRRPRVKLPDLVPAKAAHGGSAVLHPNEAPLPIPPPGFVMSSDHRNDDPQR
ncbi:MAG TPA: hypothetical protein VGC85_10830 [Chthoniobacterales bacterium]|jgi:hypothetical protein